MINWKEGMAVEQQAVVLRGFDEKGVEVAFMAKYKLDPHPAAWVGYSQRRCLTMEDGQRWCEEQLGQVKEVAE